MKQYGTWLKRYAGWVLVLGFLCIHMLTINDFGLTWDYHFHFFGGGHFLGLSWQQLEPRALPYVEPDPRFAWTLPYGPIMSIPPVVAFLLLYKTWHLLPPDSAYNLISILWGVAGIGILYIFMKQAVSSRVAILAALFLGLTPRYFGDIHNNMKDPPSAAVFALNMWLLWRLVQRKRPTDLFWAVLAFALAFNVKVNAIYIPVVFATWLLVTHFSLTKLLNLLRFSKPFIWYVLLSPLAAFGLWAVFWQHPVAQLIQMYSTFGIGTNNIEVLLNGHWYCSGSTVPWYYPWWYLGITTPIPILILFFTGLATILFNFQWMIFKKTHSSKIFHFPLYMLLLLWLFLPLTRYFIPTVGVIDGIRHFEEVLFPIAAIAAIGFDRIKPVRLMNYLALLLSCYLLFTVFSYHPYQITYFNELVGGVQGAFGKYDLDYWGTSQKAAVSWVNAHAPQNAKISIVMAPDVAGTYLRPDLLTNLNKFSYDQADFVVMLNRQSFYYRFFYAYEYLLRHTPAYTVRVHNTPLTWVFDNRTHNQRVRQTPWWQGEDPCIRPYWKGVR